MIFLDPPAESHGHSFAIERALDFERHKQRSVGTRRATAKCVSQCDLSF
jgi:hypothetical protein